MKKWVSIANYSYVNKITKSLQNEKMSFTCKLFICTQNNKIVTKWKNEFQLQIIHMYTKQRNRYKMKKWVSLANYSYVHKTTKSLQNEKMSFNCKLNSSKCNISFKVQMEICKKKIKQKWAKKTANLKYELKEWGKNSFKKWENWFFFLEMFLATILNLYEISNYPETLCWLMFWGMKDWWIKQIFSSPLQPVLGFCFCFFGFLKFVR